MCSGLARAEPPAWHLWVQAFWHELLQLIPAQAMPEFSRFFSILESGVWLGPSSFTSVRLPSSARDGKVGVMSCRFWDFKTVLTRFLPVSSRRWIDARSSLTTAQSQAMPTFWGFDRCVELLLGMLVLVAYVSN